MVNLCQQNVSRLLVSHFVLLGELLMLAFKTVNSIKIMMDQRFHHRRESDDGVKQGFF